MADPNNPKAVVRHMLSRIGHVWEDVSDLIIRPPRASYRPAALGPRLFRINPKSKDCFAREDLELTNVRGQTLQCSWYRKVDRSAYQLYMDEQRRGSDTKSAAEAALQAVASMPMTTARVPCMVYLHGNCGSRLDSRDCLFLLEEGISVFAVDLSGSGQSDGDFVSLGFYERQDLLAVVDHLTLTKQVSAIGVWGRSMGAVTAIMYAARDPTISCIVCDSPFSSLELLAKDLAMMHAGWVPGFAVGSIIGKIRDTVLDRAGFDINDLDTLAYARKSSVPAFVFHGEDDDFVRYEHSQAVADHYAGSCIHHVVKGDHNSTRRTDVRDIARAFARLYLVEKPEDAAARRGTTPPPVGEALPESPAAAAAEDEADEKTSTQDPKASSEDAEGARSVSGGDVNAPSDTEADADVSSTDAAIASDDA
jgi:pimeloyl-ACP methyl ester carboxylesterase